MLNEQTLNRLTERVKRTNFTEKHNDKSVLSRFV